MQLVNKSILFIFMGLINITYADVPNNMTQSKQNIVRMCTQYTQYIKFHSDRDPVKKKLVLFVEAVRGEAFNVISSLPGLAELPTGDTPTFWNRFTSQDKAIRTGQVFFGTRNNASVESLCGLTTDCLCESGVCRVTITTVGTRCEIEGRGKLLDPYVIVLK